MGRGARVQPCRDGTEAGGQGIVSVRSCRDGAEAGCRHKKRAAGENPAAGVFCTFASGGGLVCDIREQRVADRGLAAGGKLLRFEVRKRRFFADT